MRLALILNDKVVNTVIVDSIELAQTLWPEYQFSIQDLEIGSVKVDGVWTKPVKVRTMTTKLELLDRFTDQELIAIEDAKPNSSTLRVVNRYLDATPERFDITSPRVNKLLTILVSAGILTEARKAEILTI